MTTNELQRAAVVLFAAREAGPHASLDELKLICYCVRNRARSGWGNGHWLNVIEEHNQVAAHDPRVAAVLDIGNRNLQLLARDIDEIFFSEPREIDLKGMPEDLSDLVGRQLYWLFMDRPIRPWFEQHIVRDPKNHPQRTKLGLMMLFE